MERGRIFHKAITPHHGPALLTRYSRCARVRFEWGQRALVTDWAFLRAYVAHAASLGRGAVVVAFNAALSHLTFEA